MKWFLLCFFLATSLALSLAGCGADTFFMADFHIDIPDAGIVTLASFDERLETTAQFGPVAGDRVIDKRALVKHVRRGTRDSTPDLQALFTDEPLAISTLPIEAHESRVHFSLHSYNKCGCNREYHDSCSVSLHIVQMKHVLEVFDR